MSARAAKGTAARVAPATVRPQGKLTVEDVRRKAERIEEIARDDVDHVRKQVMAADTTRVVIVAAVSVAVVVGLAYYMGSRAAKRAAAKALAAAPSA